MDLCCVLKLQPLFIFFAQQRSRPLEFNLTSLLIMSASCTEISQVGALATCCHCLGVNETSRSLVSGHVALFPSSIWLLASLMFIVGMFFIIIIVRVRIPLAVRVLGWEDSGIGISGNRFDFLGCSIRILTHRFWGFFLSAVHRCSSTSVSSKDLGGDARPKSRCRNSPVASTRKVSQQVWVKSCICVCNVHVFRPIYRWRLIGGFTDARGRDLNYSENLVQSLWCIFNF